GWVLQRARREGYRAGVGGQPTEVALGGAVARLVLQSGIEPGSVCNNRSRKITSCAARADHLQYGGVEGHVSLVAGNVVVRAGVDVQVERELGASVDRSRPARGCAGLRPQLGEAVCRALGGLGKRRACAAPRRSVRPGGSQRKTAQERQR